MSGMKSILPLTSSALQKFDNIVIDSSTHVIDFWIGNATGVNLPGIMEIPYTEDG